MTGGGLVAVARFSGAVLRVARERRGLTRHEVAAALGVAAADRIRIWEEEAEQPRPAMIPRLAALLDLAPVELLSEVGDPPCLSALRLAAGLSRSDVVEATATLTKMTYVRLDAGSGARRLPPNSVLEELASILGVEPAAVAAGIDQARAIASAARGPA
jgi:transcriptional regulator with XRE-family HTH domain